MGETMSEGRGQPFRFPNVPICNKTHCSRDLQHVGHHVLIVRIHGGNKYDDGILTLKDLTQSILQQ